MKYPTLQIIRRWFLLTLAGSALCLFCTGCNTTRGFGKDVERTGEKIQDGTK